VTQLPKIAITPLAESSHFVIRQMVFCADTMCCEMDDM